MLTSAPAELLAPFAAIDFSNGPVVAALSGGSDSTALLTLLKNYIDQTGKRSRIVAATVDHGLRPESHAEAIAAAALAATLGVEHRIMQWDGSKPASGLPAVARLARYRLLAQVAREIGASMILTGHTVDDQAETVAMRQMRGEGPGLAGMARATLFDDSVWIVRPLISVKRMALRDFLASREIGWSDDPTNGDKTYERPRIRAKLAGASGVGDIRNLLATAAEAAAARRDLGARVASLFDMHARLAAPGLVHLAPAFRASHDQDAAVHALRILLSVVGGTRHLARAERVKDIMRSLSSVPCRATLSRVLLASRRDGVWLCRESRGLPPWRIAESGAIWDGRYRLAGPSGNSATAVAPVGAAATDLFESDPMTPATLMRTAFAGQPSFRHNASPGAYGGRQFAVERSRNGGTPGWSAQPILSPWVAFLPDFDLAPARSAARLFGASAPPDPPCADHIVTQA